MHLVMWSTVLSIDMPTTEQSSMLVSGTADACRSSAKAQQCMHRAYKPHIVCVVTLTAAQLSFVPRGAAQGEGLGNAFLSHISAVDGIYHVCRAFEDVDVTHVEDRIDPVGSCIETNVFPCRARILQRWLCLYEMCCSWVHIRHECMLIA